MKTKGLKNSFITEMFLLHSKPIWTTEIILQTNDWKYSLIQIWCKPSNETFVKKKKKKWVVCDRSLNSLAFFFLFLLSFLFFHILRISFSVFFLPNIASNFVRPFFSFLSLSGFTFCRVFIQQINKLVYFLYSLTFTSHRFLFFFFFLLA